MKPEITYNYIVNILSSANGPAFIELIEKENQKMRINENANLQYAKYYRGTEELATWDDITIKKAAQYLYSRYKSKKLSIPPFETLIEKVGDWNLSFLDNFKLASTHHIFYKALTSLRGRLFLSSIKNTNKELFADVTLTMAATQLEVCYGGKYIALWGTAHRSAFEVARYLASADYRKNLKLSATSLEILTQVNSLESPCDKLAHY